jgi:hypothetical protein
VLVAVAVVKALVGLMVVAEAVLVALLSRLLMPHQSQLKQSQ